MATGRSYESLTVLRQQSASLLLHSVALSTRNQYYSCFQRYQEFTHYHNLQVLPLLEDNLLLFATHVSRYSSHKNVNTHLAAIKFFAQTYGYFSIFPTSLRLRRLLKGIKRLEGRKYRKPKRTPITPSLIQQLGINLFRAPIKHSDKVMLWAAMLVAFFGFLRVSEYTSDHVHTYDPQFTLCFDDIRISPWVADLTLKCSKTDPFREGITVRVAYNGTPLCPVTALSNYLVSHPGTGPLFQFSDGRFLTRRGLMRILNSIKPREVKNMSTHSFRIGAATTAAAAGYPKWAIQALGRWSSDCYRIYVRISNNTISSLSRAMAAITHAIPTPFDPDNI